MPEPTSMAATTMVLTGATVPFITALGVPLGIRADILIAGFFGCLVAIILFDSVPGDDDTWRNLLRTSLRRMAAAGASAVTAGYLTPVFVHPLSPVPADPYVLGLAFVIGWGAKRAINEIGDRVMSRKTGGAQ